MSAARVEYPVNFRKHGAVALRKQGGPEPLTKKEKLVKANTADVYTKTARGMLITDSLPALQNLVKRHPEAYVDEFKAQYLKFDSVVRIVKMGLNTSKKDEEELRGVATFLGQCAHLYPLLSASLAGTLKELLLSSNKGGAVQLSGDTRKALMHALVLLRRRDVISSLDLLKTLFPLLSLTPTGAMREFILKTVLGDIKHANLKTKNHKLNRVIQGLLFGMIETQQVELSGTGVRKGSNSTNTKEAMWAVKIASSLWKKNVWRDAKTVSLIASACFHPDTKVQSAAVHFFLRTEDDAEPDSDAEDETNPVDDIHGTKHRQEINKKRKSAERRARKVIKQANKRLHGEKTNENSDFSALQLLNDPQTFAERLYRLLDAHDKQLTLDHKLLLLSLLGRVMGYYKLAVLDLYTYLMKYLAYHQLNITTILVCLADSVHDLTPPDELRPVLLKIAAEFVHSGVSAEVNAAGLNAIRAVCAKQPLAMDADLLGDLIEYRKSKDKGVMMASRSLLQLYRDVNPGLLRKRDKGKAASMRGDAALQFGVEQGQTTQIEGLELLAKHMQDKGNEEGEDAEEDDWDAWEEADSDSNSSDGWVSVASDGEIDVDLSSDDSDSDEGEKAPQRKRKLREIRLERSKRRRGDSDVSESEESDEGESETEKAEGDDDSEASSDAASDSEDESEESGDALLDITQDEMPLTRAQKELEQADLMALATSKILTPADFAKINELRIEAAEQEVKGSSSAAARRKLSALLTARKANHGEEAGAAFLTEGDILGVRKKKKMNYEERMASIAEGRKDRDKFSSNKHKKLADKAHSTTNTEKRKSKNFAMISHSRNVTRKRTASLRQKSRRLQNHVTRQKNGGRRRNGMQ